MSCAITFFFKEIFPNIETWRQFFKDYDINSLDDLQDLSFANYLYKIIYRRFCNSNVQYETQEEFKNDLANIIEDIFDKYKRQVELAKKISQITDEELLELSSSLTNSGSNPNSQPNDPKKPIDYFGQQIVNYAKSNKMTGYLLALRSIPTKLIEEILTDCARLFKSIVGQEIYYY